MDIRYFRHLFRCDDNEMIQEGSLWDTVTNERTTYVYISGTYDLDDLQKGQQAIREEEPLDLCVLGSYTYSGIMNLLECVRMRDTRAVVLPYVSPMQRLFLANQVPIDCPKRKELMEFFDHPEQCVKKNGAENIFFLYENGTPLSDDNQCLADGYQFEAASVDILEMIYDMEGEGIPVVKSGYILVNQWLFYFGTFGPKLADIRDFVEEEITNRNHVSSGQEGYRELVRVLNEFQKKFGPRPYGTVSMYHGPVKEAFENHDVLMTGRPFQQDRNCKSVIPLDGTTCAMRCQHDYDYEMFQHCINKQKNEARMGIWLLGSLDLRRYLPEASRYFLGVLHGICAIGIPDYGKSKGWDNRLLCLLEGEDHIYFMLPVTSNTQGALIADILNDSAYHRLINIGSNQGYCICGSLIRKNGIPEF